mmetsp:Transcript_8940/g.26847  ORF Transcript_8940/g.26847 Transcript_8940/m.26847 type:complete len:218 (+) Transcript_8940:1606-2259(+)
MRKILTWRMSWMQSPQQMRNLKMMMNSRTWTKSRSSWKRMSLGRQRGRAPLILSLQRRNIVVMLETALMATTTTETLERAVANRPQTNLGTRSTRKQCIRVPARRILIATMTLPLRSCWTRWTQTRQKRHRTITHWICCPCMKMTRRRRLFRHEQKSLLRRRAQADNPRKRSSLPPRKRPSPTHWIGCSRTKRTKTPVQQRGVGLDGRIHPWATLCK